MDARNGNRQLFLTAALAACVVCQGGCEARGGDRRSPDVAAADTSPEARRAAEQLAAEQDTLVRTLQTAMVLLGEVAEVEREIAGGARELREGAELEPWDARVRGQLTRLRSHYAELSGELARSESRLRELQRADRSLRASLDAALRVTDSLRADNARMQRVIADLTGRIGELELENRDVTAKSAARADSITRLVDEKNAAYWIAGTKDELRDLGLIDVVGGRQLVFARVGETLALSRELKLDYMHAVDRRTASVIVLPDDAQYEIVTSQNLRFVDPTTLRADGTRRYVRGELRIQDPEFWSHADVLILVRK